MEWNSHLIIICVYFICIYHSSAKTAEEAINNTEISTTNLIKEIPLKVETSVVPHTLTKVSDELNATKVNPTSSKDRHKDRMNILQPRSRYVSSYNRLSEDNCPSVADTCPACIAFAGDFPYEICSYPFVIKVLLLSTPITDNGRVCGKFGLLSALGTTNVKNFRRLLRFSMPDSCQCVIKPSQQYIVISKQHALIKVGPLYSKIAFSNDVILLPVDRYTEPEILRPLHGCVKKFPPSTKEDLHKPRTYLPAPPPVYEPPQPVYEPPPPVYESLPPQAPPAYQPPPPQPTLPAYVVPPPSPAYKPPPPPPPQPVYGQPPPPAPFVPHLDHHIGHNLPAVPLTPPAPIQPPYVPFPPPPGIFPSYSPPPVAVSPYPQSLTPIIKQPFSPILTNCLLPETCPKCNKLAEGYLDEKYCLSSFAYLAVVQFPDRSLLPNAYQKGGSCLSLRTNIIYDVSRGMDPQLLNLLLSSFLPINCPCFPDIKGFGIVLILGYYTNPPADRSNTQLTEDFTIIYLPAPSKIKVPDCNALYSSHPDVSLPYPDSPLRTNISPYCTAEVEDSCPICLTTVNPAEYCSATVQLVVEFVAAGSYILPKPKPPSVEIKTTEINYYKSTFISVKKPTPLTCIDGSLKVIQFLSPPHYYPPQTVLSFEVLSDCVCALLASAPGAKLLIYSFKDLKLMPSGVLQLTKDIKLAPLGLYEELPPCVTPLPDYNLPLSSVAAVNPPPLEYIPPSPPEYRLPSPPPKYEPPPPLALSPPSPPVYESPPPEYKEPPASKLLPPTPPVYKPATPPPAVYEPAPLPPPVYEPVPPPPPVYKPSPPPPPVYKPAPPLPPVYASAPPPPPLVYEPSPPPPVYEPSPPPLPPVYKPAPPSPSESKPPPLPVPDYKKRPPPPPVYEPSPLPVYEPPPSPVYEPPPPPVYEPPPSPVYEPPPPPVYEPPPSEYQSPPPSPQYKPPPPTPLPSTEYKQPSVYEPLPPPEYNPVAPPSPPVYVSPPLEYKPTSAEKSLKLISTAPTVFNTCPMQDYSCPECAEYLPSNFKDTYCLAEFAMIVAVGIEYDGINYNSGPDPRIFHFKQAPKYHDIFQAESSYEIVSKVYNDPKDGQSKLLAAAEYKCLQTKIKSLYVVTKGLSPSEYLADLDVFIPAACPACPVILKIPTYAIILSKVVPDLTKPLQLNNQFQFYKLPVGELILPNCVSSSYAQPDYAQPTVYASTAVTFSVPPVLPKLYMPCEYPPSCPTGTCDAHLGSIDIQVPCDIKHAIVVEVVQTPKSKVEIGDIKISYTIDNYNTPIVTIDIKGAPPDNTLYEEPPDANDCQFARVRVVKDLSSKPMLNPGTLLTLISATHCNCHIFTVGSGFGLVMVPHHISGDTIYVGPAKVSCLLGDKNKIHLCPQQEYDPVLPPYPPAPSPPLYGQDQMSVAAPGQHNYDPQPTPSQIPASNTEQYLPLQTSPPDQFAGLLPPGLTKSSAVCEHTGCPVCGSSNEITPEIYCNAAKVFLVRMVKSNPEITNNNGCTTRTAHALYEVTAIKNAMKSTFLIISNVPVTCQCPALEGKDFALLMFRKFDTVMHSPLDLALNPDIHIYLVPPGKLVLPLCASSSLYPRNRGSETFIVDPVDNELARIYRREQSLTVCPTNQATCPVCEDHPLPASELENIACSSTESYVGAIHKETPPDGVKTNRRNQRVTVSHKPENNFTVDISILPGELEDICNLEMQTGGTCNSPSTRFYYNNKTRTCEEFRFTGCKGNYNNFISQQACIDTCIKENYCHEGTFKIANVFKEEQEEYKYAMHENCNCRALTDGGTFYLMTNATESINSNSILTLNENFYIIPFRDTPISCQFRFSEITSEPDSTEVRSMGKNVGVKDPDIEVKMTNQVVGNNGKPSDEDGVEETEDKDADNRRGDEKENNGEENDTDNNSDSTGKLATGDSSTAGNSEYDTTLSNDEFSDDDFENDNESTNPTEEIAEYRTIGSNDVDEEYKVAVTDYEEVSDEEKIDDSEENQARESKPKG